MIGRRVFKLCTAQGLHVTPEGIAAAKHCVQFHTLK